MMIFEGHYKFLNAEKRSGRYLDMDSMWFLINYK